MNETRAPTNEKLKEQILKQYKKGVKPKELSEKTGVSINTIKSWIKREKEKLGSTSQGASEKKKDAPSKQKKGAPLGNKNAQGAGAPERNKNAEKHGAFSTIYWDFLNDEELKLIQDIPMGEEYQLKQQIAMYTIRERRLMYQIQNFKESSVKNGLYVKSVKKKKRIIINKDGTRSDFFEDMNTETEYAVKVLVTLETELTKVQRAKTKCIDSLIHLRAVNERYDDLLNGWKTKAEMIAGINDIGGDEGISIYLPDNGRE